MQGIIIKKNKVTEEKKTEEKTLLITEIARSPLREEAMCQNQESRLDDLVTAL